MTRQETLNLGRESRFGWVVRRMTPTELLVFYLRVERGMDLQDIAELFGVKKTAVSKVLKGLYQRLRDEL